MLLPILFRQVLSSKPHTHTSSSITSTPRSFTSLLYCQQSTKRYLSRLRNKQPLLSFEFLLLARTTGMSPTAATRSKALSLYRQLLREAQKMPTPNRKNFVIRKTRIEFKASVGLTDADAINEAIRLADTNLDTVMVQAEHLNKLMKDPNYQIDI